MPTPVPAYVREIEDANPGYRVCYHCRTLLAEDLFAAGRQRECKACRAQRYGDLSERDRLQNLIGVAKWRAQKKGLPFNLTVDDLEVPDRCPVFGMPLAWGTRKQRDNSPSLDRIIPEKGYVPGNVLVVSWLANNVRRDFTPDQLRIVADFYAAL